MKKELSAAAKWPLEIKRGNVMVKTYAGKNRVLGTASPQYTLTFYDGAAQKKRLGQGPTRSRIDCRQLANRKK